MTDRLFIDTNVLLYAYDRNAGRKHEIAKELIKKCWLQTSGVISIQVLCEFFVRATRPNNTIVYAQEAAAIINNLSDYWQIIIPDVFMIQEAIRGSKVYCFSFWDAMIWAAAKKSGIKKLYTEDFQSGQVVEEVVFVDPFKEV
ncbi:MAG: PIN domain-containing protein [Candidatus Schekmanbacteria bacterium]|nr:PIN domain-containing protein [Candidatus Schekmanbacteria bacterium]